MTSVARPCRLRDGKDAENQFDPVAHADPLEEPGEMGSHGRNAQSQLRGDVLVGMAPQDQGDDLRLLRRQAKGRHHVRPGIRVKRHRLAVGGEIRISFSASAGQRFVLTTTVSASLSCHACAFISHKAQK